MGAKWVLGLVALTLAMGAAWAQRAEPTGGTWRTVVLASGGATVVPAPPPAGSLATAKELRLLRERQALRTPEVIATAQGWEAGGVLRWHAMARALVSRHQTTPPLASRVYALLSVAQYDTLVAACAAQYRYRRPAPAAVAIGLRPLFTPSDPCYPSTHAALGAASAAVLAFLYPDAAEEVAALAEEEADSRLWAGVNYVSDLIAGESLGGEVAAQVIARAKADGADVPWTGTVPTGPGRWYSSNDPPLPPLQPTWGQVRPWLLPSVTALRPPPPPAYGSPEFLAALAEVRRIADTRTPEQTAIARAWADSPGTPTPPGHWDLIACQLIARDGLNELRAARVLAATHMAQMDAGICCWDAKYTYWLLRPSQADPAITLAVGLPNFPSYPSGHSTFSAAASTVLGALFPRDRAALRALAEEAGISRVYAGLHYPFDNVTGLSGGERVGAQAVQWLRASGGP